MVLKAYMHCENCAVEIKKTILKMKGKSNHSFDIPFHLLIVSLSIYSF